ncbi:MAG: hypothetical protein AAF798_07660 [Bacteroidota bacterium]
MKNVLTFLAIAMCFTLQAQDQLILKSGETIAAKVLELAPQQIKYKRFDHLSGPTIVIARAEVFLINYENGKSEVISPVQQAAPTVTTTVPEEAHSDDIYVGQKSYERTSTNYSTNSIPYNEEEVLIAAGAAVPLGSYYSTGFFLNVEGDWYQSPNFGFTSSFGVAYNNYNDPYEYESGNALDLLSQSGIVGRTNPGVFTLYGKAMIGGVWTTYSGDFDDTLGFTLGGGAGFVINEQIDLGLRYYNIVGTDFSQLQIGLGYRF